MRVQIRNMVRYDLDGKNDWRTFKRSQSRCPDNRVMCVLNEVHMRIETERCLIRRFEEMDIGDFMIYRNNEKWMQYQGFKGLTKPAK